MIDPNFSVITKDRDGKTVVLQFPTEQDLDNLIELLKSAKVEPK